MNLELKRDHLKYSSAFGTFRLRLSTHAVERLQRSRPEVDT